MERVLGGIRTLEALVQARVSLFGDRRHGRVARRPSGNVVIWMCAGRGEGKFSFHPLVPFASLLLFCATGLADGDRGSLSGHDPRCYDGMRTPFEMHALMVFAMM